MPELNNLDSFSSYTPVSGSIITLFAEEDGKIVMKAKKSDGSIETLYGQADDSGGEETELFRCSGVGGPYTTSGYVVSGAGKEEVNGKYILTDIVNDSETPVYKHATREYYYVNIWDEEGIVTSPTDYPGNGLYYNMWGEGWTTGSNGVEPAPSVEFDEHILMNQGAPKVWIGNKVVITDNGCALELDSPSTTVCTHGYEVESSPAAVELTYHHGFKPVVGRVYTKDASLMVGGIHVGASPSLVFHKSFRTWTDRAETGQLLIPYPFGLHDLKFENYTLDSGKSISAISGGGFIAEDENGNFPYGNNPVSLSVCVLQTESYMNNCWCIQLGSHNNICLGFSSNRPRVVAQNTSADITFGYDIAFNRFYHLCATFDGSVLRLYVDGSPAGSAEVTLNVKKDMPLVLGLVGYGANYTLPVAVADARVYNYALSASEVASLANEFK